MGRKYINSVNYFDINKIFINLVRHKKFRDLAKFLTKFLCKLAKEIFVKKFYAKSYSKFFYARELINIILMNCAYGIF